MRIHVELEDGKSETVFVPQAAMREALNEGLDGSDVAAYCAWWAMDRKGLLPSDIDDWEAFTYVAAIRAVEDTPDPKE